jgi:LCP family protein required for cell wall assembly
MVASIDPNTNLISLVSIPRDFWVDINLPNGTTYKERINTSYAAGLLNEGSVKAGAEQLAHDINFNFGIEIDEWMIVDFKGVEALIDALGGMEITIPPELAVPEWWYGDESGDPPPHWIEFPAGIQTVTGYEAVAFGRYRGDGDLNRVKRQQLVVQTALQRAFAKGILNTNPFDLWDAYNKAIIRHSIATTKLITYADLLKRSAGNTKTYSLGDEVNGVLPVYDEIIDGKAVLIWDPELVQYTVAQAFAKTKYANSVVEIQNAADDGGARAAALGRYLKFVKYLPTVDIGADVSAQPATTILLFSEDRKPMAQDIAEWLSLPESAIQPAERTSASQPDVLVIVGADFILPSE